MKRIAFIFSLVGCLIALASCSSKHPNIDGTYYYGIYVIEGDVFTDYSLSQFGKKLKYEWVSDHIIKVTGDGDLRYFYIDGDALFEIDRNKVGEKTEPKTTTTH